MDRRRLIQWLVSTGGLSALGPLSVRDLLSIGEAAHRRASSISHTTGLSPSELRAVSAAAECIIPKTDTPGATDAGVSAFIDLMLAEWYPEADVERFRGGLRALDVASQARFQRGFADLGSPQQAELLQQLDNEATAAPASAASTRNGHWFAMLKYLTVWGFCTSEVGMREVLHSYPRPLKYDGSAPVS